jgi:hypothetical protein
MLVIRAVDSVDTALARLADGQVAAALVPASAVPAGGGGALAGELLPPAVARAAAALAVLAFVAGALAVATRWSGSTR